MAQAWIEVLVKAGRLPETGALAKRYLAEHGGSPLANRVARLVRSPKP